MTDLSPAAQKVLDAMRKELDYAPIRHLQWAGAAAIRALADQVVPDEDEVMRHAIPDAYDQREATRAQLLAIATELEGQ